MFKVFFRHRSRREKFKYSKSFSDSDSRQEFLTEKNLKTSKYFQSGTPDGKNRKKFKVFSERDFRQRKVAKKTKSLETAPQYAPKKVVISNEESTYGKTLKVQSLFRWGFQTVTKRKTDYPI